MSSRTRVNNTRVSDGESTDSNQTTEPETDGSTDSGTDSDYLPEQKIHSRGPATGKQSRKQNQRVKPAPADTVRQEHGPYKKVRNASSRTSGVTQEQKHQKVIVLSSSDSDENNEKNDVIVISDTDSCISDGGEVNHNNNLPPKASHHTLQIPQIRPGDSVGYWDRTVPTGTRYVHTQVKEIVQQKLRGNPLTRLIFVNNHSMTSGNILDTVAVHNPDDKQVIHKLRKVRDYQLVLGKMEGNPATSSIQLGYNQAVERIKKNHPKLASAINQQL